MSRSCVNKKCGSDICIGWNFCPDCGTAQNTAVATPSASNNMASLKFLQDIKESFFEQVQRKYCAGPVSREMDVAVEMFNFILQKLQA